MPSSQIKIALCAAAGVVTIITAFALNGAQSNRSPLDTCLRPESAFENISISVDGTKAYLTDPVSNKIWILSTSTDRIKGAIQIPDVGKQVIFTRDGARAFVVAGKDVGVLLELDTSTDTIAKKIPIGVRKPRSIALSPDGLRAYLTTSNAAQLLVIDTTTGVIEASISTSDYPGAHTDRVTVSPDGKRAYVTTSDQGGGTVSIVDTKSNVVLHKISVAAGTFSDGIAASPDGRNVFVTLLGDPGAVKVIDTSAGSIVATIVVGSHPQEIAITPDGTRAYVTNHLSDPGTLSVIDVHTHVVTTIVLGDVPGRIAIAPDGKKAYVVSANRNGSYIAVVDLQSKAVIAKQTTASSEEDRCSGSRRSSRESEALGQPEIAETLAQVALRQVVTRSHAVFRKRRFFLLQPAS